jgi:hypothetical protein
MPKDNPGPQGASFVSIDDADARDLQSRADELDAQIRELEARLAVQAREIETLRSTTCDLGKGALDLRARHVKADSRSPRLKGEIHRRDSKLPSWKRPRSSPDETLGWPPT